MALSKISKSNKLVVVGLNSGTSADGVDIAAVSVSTKKVPYNIEFLSGVLKGYPARLKTEINNIIEFENATPDDVIFLDQALGKFFAKEARAFIAKLEKEGVDVDLIASHGQTVRHLPAKTRYAQAKVNGTLQLGSLDQIAAITGKVVTGDFRQADIALGNEGAPITVAAMGDMFATPKQSRLIVNIGGMSNYFYFPDTSSGQYPRASDCGPGNYLSDQLTGHFYSQAYDKNGRLASNGIIDKKLLSSLEQHPFFKTSRRSTGVEDFGVELVAEILRYGKQNNIKPDDLIATVAALTARSVVKAVRPILNKDSGLRKLYLTGGGVRNTFIRNQIQSELTSIEVKSTDELGFDSSQTEAVAYAVMGAACVKARPMPTRFDGKKQTVWPVSGRIVQPPVMQMETLDD